MTETDVRFWRNYARVTAANLGVAGDDIEDLAQDALVDVLAAWTKPTGNRKDYLSRVVRNCVIDWLRVRGYRQHLSIDDNPTDYSINFHRNDERDCDGFESFESAQQAKTLTENVIVDYIVCKEIVENADEHDRQILKLFASGHSDSQIAKALGLTSQAVKIVIERVRRQTRRACSDV